MTVLKVTYNKGGEMGRKQ